MTKPLLTIGLMHGAFNGDMVRVRVAVGRKTVGECYLSAAELMKCIACQATPCVLTYAEAAQEYAKAGG